MALSLAEREVILEQQIARYTDKGWRIKPGTRTSTDAVLIPPGRKGNAVADGCLTVAWLGLWLIPAIIGKDRYKKVTIHINTDGSVDIIGPRP